MHHGNVSPQIAQGLIKLKQRIDAAKIPPSTLDETINVAIWNIREFGKVHRTDAAIHYIAEILGQFDLVALVELRSDLTDLGRVLPILGPSWDVVYSDWMDDSGGNSERIAFLFDERAVTFNGLAAEIDAPRSKKGDEYLAGHSFWRAPYMCSFRSGNFDFIAIAEHARWGKDLAGRQAELQMLADWIDARFKDKNVEDKDLIVLGDFNTPSLDDDLLKALTSRGLLVPEALRNLTVGDRTIGGSNLSNNARYDQILHMPSVADRFSNLGGTLDFYLNKSKIADLFPDGNYTKEKFSFQLSDHFPVWVQIKTNIDGERLDQIVQDGKK
ncbi:MAG TPA: endonuclease/exonuclease/phosphatase family protein [Chitinivibrionales bacterium]|nr:endonuclease/exonuclease/phosphatase family protein [Chitinivibrionales bacterium]